MRKNVASTTQNHECYIGKEAKVNDYLGKTHENLSKKEGKPILIDDHRSSVGELMLFATKLGPKLCR